MPVRMAGILRWIIALPKNSHNSTSCDKIGREEQWPTTQNATKTYYQYKTWIKQILKYADHSNKTLIFWFIFELFIFLRVFLYFF